MEFKRKKENNFTTHSTNEGPDATVTIMNKAQLEAVLNREYQEYFSLWVEDLKSHGFSKSCMAEGLTAGEK